MVVTEPAPAFSLPTVDAGSRGLADLVADGPAVIVFVAEECPTCVLALRRLAALVAPLSAAGVTLTAVFEDEPEVAARVTRRTGFGGPVFAEPAPYEVSQAYGLETLPTTVLVDTDGAIAGRVVGWDRVGLQALMEQAGVEPGTARVTSEPPELKPGCAAKNTYDAATLEALDSGDEAEEMYSLGWTDGLPVVPPTPERVQAMLGSYDPDRSLGPVPPSMGEATVRRVAACAVLAGCRPAYFPVVLAAVEAALDPASNVGGQAVTTQPAGQLLVVNGPVRERVGLHSGTGVLGPGFRPNLTIGRALRLVITLTGGARPGGLDRSTLGQPGKIGICIAEDEETSPWESFAVERGFDPGASTVTLVACDSPLSISDHRSRTPEELAWALGSAAATQWAPAWWPLDEPSLYVICPEHAALFRDAGWTKEQVRRAIFEAVRRPARELRRAETTPAVHAADPDTVVHKWSDPEQILLVVAGGEAGRYSAVFGPCTGMDAAVVTREIRP
ncbi:MAG: peroxiredoxin family protein [Streptosporangiales bacterium]